MQTQTRTEQEKEILNSSKQITREANRDTRVPTTVRGLTAKAARTQGRLDRTLALLDIALAL